MSKYKSGWMDFEEASYLSDLFQQIVTDCRVSSENYFVWNYQLFFHFIFLLCWMKGSSKSF